MSAALSHRERVRFLEFEFSRLPNGRCRARVVLERMPEERFVGVAEGLGSQTGELRCSAAAATDALSHTVPDEVQLELLGVKAVRAFDSTVVIVSLSCHNGVPPTRLVGSCITDEETNRSAALAVLNATNRFLGNVIFAR